MPVYYRMHVKDILYASVLQDLLYVSVLKDLLSASVLKYILYASRAPENGNRGTRLVRTKHNLLDKRKFQLTADWTQLTADCTNSQQIGQTVQEMGQTLLKIRQIIAQSNILSILMGNLSNIADGCTISKQFSL